jgi:hypothetical protein
MAQRRAETGREGRIDVADLRRSGSDGFIVVLGVLYGGFWGLCE